MPQEPTEPTTMTTSEWEDVATAANLQGNDLNGNPWTASSVAAAYPGLTPAQKRILQLLALAALATG